MIALRWQEEDGAARLDFPLAPDYTLDELQARINFAIEHGGEVALLGATGRPLRFRPSDWKRLSVVDAMEA